MPRPFAKGENDAPLTPIGSSEGDNVNYYNGFPSVYSSPHSDGGKYITRGEMNAIGNLASQNQFYFLAGGINTFDATFASIIGGYPKDAVLKYLNNGYLYDVISLVDNNTVDFTAQGVDGVNWAYLSVPEKETFEDIFFEGASGLAVGTALIAIIKAKKTASIVLETSITPVLGSLKSTYPYFGTNTLRMFAGCGLMIKDVGTSIPQTVDAPEVVGTQSGQIITVVNWNGWKSLSGSYTGIYSPGSDIYFDEQKYSGFLSEVTKDHYYALSLFCQEGDFENDLSEKNIVITKYSSLSGSVKILYAS